MFGFNSPKIPEVELEDVKNAMDNNETFFLLDVRTAGEYSRGGLAKSINLTVDKVEEQILQILPDKSAKIYVYCLSGSRSVVAVNIMVKLGYKNVFNMKQGLLAWRAKNFPIKV